MRIVTSKPSAAVVVVLLNEFGEDKILLTLRADWLREHAGEVALPGGKREQEDSSLYRTALRECYEEVGIPATDLTYRTELTTHFTRGGAEVTPYVVDIGARPALTLCVDEIASAQWVPVSLFKEDRRTKTHIFKHLGREYWAPVYHYNGYEIWGFTARVLVSFVNTFYGDKLVRAHHSAPEEIFMR